MYVSIKNEEKMSLTKIATRKFTGQADNKEISRSRASSSFERALDKSRGSERLERKNAGLSKSGNDTSKRQGKSAEKANFNSSKNREIRRNEEQKTNDKIKKSESKIAEQTEKIKNQKDGIKENVGSKKELTQNSKPVAENKNAEPTEKFEEIIKNNAANQSEIIAMMIQTMNEFKDEFSDSQSSDIEKLMAVIENLPKDLSLSQLIAEDGKLDLTEHLNLEDFEKIFQMNEAKMIKIQETLENMKDFSKNFLNSMKAEENLDYENGLEHLLSKLGFVSAEVKTEGADNADKNMENIQKSMDDPFAKTLREELNSIKESMNNSNQNSKNGEGSAVLASMKSENGVAKSKIDGLASDFANKMEAVMEKTDLKVDTQIKSNMKTEIFNQIKNHIVKQSVKADNSEMIIKLRPEELGKVELKIEVHKDQVIAKMNVASQMVKEAIEANLSDLKSSLKDKGFDVMSFNVDVRDDSNQAKENESSPRQRRRAIKLNIEDGAEIVNETYIKSLEALDQGSTFEKMA